MRAPLEMGAIVSFFCARAVRRYQVITGRFPGYRFRRWYLTAALLSSMYGAQVQNRRETAMSSKRTPAAIPQSNRHTPAARLPNQSPLQSAADVNSREQRQERKTGGGKRPAPTPAAAPSRESAAARKTASFGESVCERAASAAV